MSENIDRNADADADARPAPEDSELVRSTMRGDLSAFEALVGRYQRRATAIAFRMLSNREDAMDVVQDAFLKAYDKLSSLSTPGRFGPWLLRIVSNLSLNFRRSRALRKAESLETPDDQHAHGRMNRPDKRASDPPAEASAHEMSGLMAEAIDELPEMQRRALILFAIEQLPQKEIAGMLSCSVEAVKWHVFTARKKLKERLG